MPKQACPNNFDQYKCYGAEMSATVIRPLSAEDGAPCAQMMSQSDAWLTLGREYEA